MKATAHRPRRRRLIWVVPVLLVLLFGGRWGLKAVTGSEGKWVSVERDDLVLGVEVEGTLKAVETDLLGPPQLPEMWQFKVAYLAPEGEDVTAGTKVLGFDASELQQRLQREVAERDAARKRVEKAEREQAVHLARNELDLEEARAEQRKAALKAESPETLEAARDLAKARLDLELADARVAYLDNRLESTNLSAEATLAALENQLEQAEQQVEQIESAIAQMSIAAPRDGTVIHVSNWRDEKKKVGDSCWRGEEVIELPDLSVMRGMGQVHEADAGRVAEEQRVTFRLDAHPETEFSGQVGSIWRTVQRESWRSPLKVVRLEVELDETDTRRMRPGMRFRGKVEIDRVAEALLVDAESIFLRPEGPVVYRRTWLGHEEVRVKLGRRNEKRVEVLEGLTEGDRISPIDLKAQQGQT